MSVRQFKELGKELRKKRLSNLERFLKTAITVAEVAEGGSVLTRRDWRRVGEALNKMEEILSDEDLREALEEGVEKGLVDPDLDPTAYQQFLRRVRNVLAKHRDHARNYELGYIARSAYDILLFLSRYLIKDESS